MGDKKTKNLVIVTMLMVIVVMITAVVVLARNNDIFKPRPDGSGMGKWKVLFTSIAEGEKTGNAKSAMYPYYTGTYANFYATFESPGDSMVYDVQISNLGTLDSKLSSIIYITNPYKDAIKYEVIGINEGEILKAGEVRNIKVKISYELTSTVAYTFDKPISILFNFVQA